MARISKSAEAPPGGMHFSLGHTEFDIDDATPVYETADPAIIAAARLNAHLTVEEDSVAPPVPEAEAISVSRESLDPHKNPSADHLSTSASPAAIEAAAQNDAAIRAVVGNPERSDSADPGITAALTGMLRAAGVDGDPATIATVKGS